MTEEPRPLDDLEAIRDGATSAHLIRLVCRHGQSGPGDEALIEEASVHPDGTVWLRYAGDLLLGNRLIDQVADDERLAARRVSTSGNVPLRERHSFVCATCGENLPARDENLARAMNLVARSDWSVVDLSSLRRILGRI